MNLPTTHTNWVRDFVREERSSVVTRLRFKKGVWLTQDDKEVPIGTELVANVSSVRCGYIRFHGAGKPPEKALATVASGERIVRDDLSDPNPASWPLKNGEPEDPWNQIYELDTADPETGDQFVIVAMSWTAREAVLNLLSDWEIEQANHLNKLPLIALGATSRDIGQYKDIASPVFNIGGWIENTGVITQKEDLDQDGSDGGDNDPGELNDQIPF